MPFVKIPSSGQKHRASDHSPTPCRAVALIREHRASMHPETQRAWATDAVDELGRLQAENERLLEMAQALYKAEADARPKET